MSSEKGPIFEGYWGENAHWELVESKEIPPIELCTAVFCVAFTPDGKVILMRPKTRGWGLIGGHIEIEKGESIEEARDREAAEEGGFIPDNPQPFAHLKITSDIPVPKYPHPTSYQIYYHSGIRGDMFRPTGEEVEESGLFSLEEARLLISAQDSRILELGNTEYQSQRNKKLKN
jgi:ADP-ribose pyrophosphatase YjhB (NUDIX family)